MTFPSRRPRMFAVLATLTSTMVLLLGACGAGSGDASATETGPTELRLGYFPNLTHASAIVGVERGIFKRRLAEDTLSVSTFNAGPAAIEALFSGALDAAYLGPSPAINAYVKSNGDAIRIISGATSGGAFLVVKPSINRPADLRGKKIASPQLGGTQDVALRFWLDDHGIDTNPEGGGDVSVVPQENAQTLETFRSGAIAGAWVPEPWATRLVLEGGGKVLVDEATLWPEGAFATTVLVVRTAFLNRHPDTVRKLLEGQVEANAFIAANENDAKTMVNAGIEKITSKRLAEGVIVEAWKNLRFTNDPIAPSLAVSARHANEVGLLGKVDLDGIYALQLLNEVLEGAGEEEVEGA